MYGVCQSKGRTYVMHHQYSIANVSIKCINFTYVSIKVSYVKPGCMVIVLFNDRNAWCFDIPFMCAVTQKLVRADHFSLPK